MGFAICHVAAAIFATMTGSDFNNGEAGVNLPEEACTIDIESSTVMD